MAVSHTTTSAPATVSVDPERPLLVFGGPYSNLRATEALIARAAALGIAPQQAICTGDVVAYAAEPEETAALLRAWGCHVVKGNCEESLAEAAPDCGCNFTAGSACDRLAKGWYPFASARVSQGTRGWMAALPPAIRFSYRGLQFHVLHGGTRETARWVFGSMREAIAEELALARADVVVAGHCGLPFITRASGGVWMNPGVIGMPANDATSDVWYGLVTPLDGAGTRLSIHRLAYDHAAAAAAMRRTGHANGYARTLVTGLWPSLDVLPAREREAAGKRLRIRQLDVPADSAQPRAAARSSAIA
jgi:predicted phosphodiesterase